MTKYNYIFAFALSALLFSACGDSDNASEYPITSIGNLDGIAISTTVDGRAYSQGRNNAKTRTDFGLATKVGDGQIIYTWVDDAGGSSIAAMANLSNPPTATTTEAAHNGHYWPIRNCTSYTQTYYSDNMGIEHNVLRLYSTTKEIGYPKDGHSINIYAIHNNYTAHTIMHTAIDSLEFSEVNNRYSHTVEIDQTSMTNYAKSDLLWGRKIGQGATKDTIHLPMWHMLSNIVITYHSDMDLNLLNQITDIKLRGAFRTCDFLVNRDSLWLIDGSTIKGNSYTSTYSNMFPIKISNDFGTGRLNEAIILPQTVDTAEFLSFTTPKNTYIYEWRGKTNGVKFEKGKQYIFTIDIDTTGFGIVASVCDWNMGTTTTIPNLEMAKGANGTTLNESKVIVPRTLLKCVPRKKDE